MVKVVLLLEDTERIPKCVFDKAREIFGNVTFERAQLADLAACYHKPEQFVGRIERVSHHAPTGNSRRIEGFFIGNLSPFVQV